MLAQNFKTADELGLVPEALPAPIKVLRLLEQGELVWSTHPVQNGFHMSVEWQENECGTVGCIIGWARHLEPTLCRHLTVPGYTRAQKDAIERLYYPGHTNLRTVEEAAHALRTYLVTGTPEWA